MLFRFFHTRPLLLGIILAIISLLGVIGYLNMPRNMYPDVERPQVTVITQLPGASALSVAQKLSRWPINHVASGLNPGFLLISAISERQPSRLPRLGKTTASISSAKHWDFTSENKSSRSSSQGSQ